jgi:hypothetical protein
LRILLTLLGLVCASTMLMISHAEKQQEAALDRLASYTPEPQPLLSDDPDHITAKARSMTDEQLAAMHRLLAEYHRRLAKEAVLDVVRQYRADLGQRLADEAALIPRRTAIVERLHEREQQIAEDDGEDE